MVRPLVEEFLQGKSGMLAALGPSGSGKTHTVFGTPRDSGMVPRALQQIFKEKRNGQFYVSIFEISSEQRKVERVCDLSPEGTELSMQQSTIKGLRKVAVSDASHAESLINLAMLKRATAMTKTNSQSSRSQCIINIIYSASKDEVELDDHHNCAVLTIVDLAGAEREKRTGNQGSRLLESNFINNTVMVFGQCLRSLLEYQKNPKKPIQKHYQNSLLTRYLRDYLVGKKRMTLILTVKSEVESYLDTMYLLRQASPYMTIKFEKVEPMKLVQNKRQMQTLPAQGQLKKLKTNPVHVCEVEGRDIPDENPLLLAESPRNNKPYVIDLTPLKLEGKCAESRDDRNHLIMQSFAKTIWNVLKECNKKLKNAEKENLHLKENFENEKKRSMELETELRGLKFCCHCCKASSEGISDIQSQKELTLDTELGEHDGSNNADEFKGPQTTDIRLQEELTVDAALDEQDEPNKADELSNIEDLKCNTFLELPDCHEDNVAEKNASTKPPDLQSSECSNTNKNPMPLVLSDLEGVPQPDRSGHFLDTNTFENNGSVTKEDQNSQEQSSESPWQQKVQFPERFNLESQDFEADPESCRPSKERSSQDFQARAESCSPPNDKSSQDFQARGESYKPSEDKPSHDFYARAETCKSSKDKSSKDLLARAESYKPSKDKPSLDFEAKKETQKPSNAKPRRRLLPASSNLLRDFTALGIHDEPDRRKVGKGGKGIVVNERQRTQGSISLLRLLQRDLHI